MSCKKGSEDGVGQNLTPGPPICLNFVVTYMNMVM
jgi:hypothetical protein